MYDKGKNVHAMKAKYDAVLKIDIYVSKKVKEERKPLLPIFLYSISFTFISVLFACIFL